MRTLTVLVLLGAVAAADDRKVAAKRGLAYLDKHLLRLPNVQGTPRNQFTYAVSGLCYLMEGASRTGKNRIAPIKDYLIRYLDEVTERTADPKQLPVRHGMVSSASMGQYTWPVAAAGMFFGELQLRGLYARDTRRALGKVVAILEAAQEENGGWGHGRVQKTGGGYPNTLVSSSNCVAISLGLLSRVPGTDIRALPAARTYYRNARLTNGSFPYDPSQRSSGSAKINAGRTAGAIFAIHCLGMARDSAFLGSVAYLEQNLKWCKEGHGSPCLNMMHTALASRMLGRKAWSRFREMYDKPLLAAQSESGALNCICEGKAFGVTCDSREKMSVFQTGQEVYTTALHTFVLLLDRDELKLLKVKVPTRATTPRRKPR